MNRCQTKALLLKEVTVWVGTQTRADHFQYEAGLVADPTHQEKVEEGPHREYILDSHLGCHLLMTNHIPVCSYPWCQACDTETLLVLQVRKGRPREVRQLSQGHAGNSMGMGTQVSPIRS